MNKTRIIFDICIFFGIFFMPWWLSAILILASIVYFPLFVESVVLGFLFDILYRPSRTLISFSSLISLILVVLVFYIKTKVRK